MIENQEGLVVSQEQLAKLRAWEKEIVNELNLHPRLKKSELAGIRRMIAQIEREIRVYNLARLQDSIDELEGQAQKLTMEELPVSLSQNIRTIRELTAALEPVM